MAQVLQPEDFVYFRHNALSGADYPPTKLNHRELKAVLSASVSDFNRALARLMQGKRVRTRYGIYWAQQKNI